MKTRKIVLLSLVILTSFTLFIANRDVEYRTKIELSVLKEIKSNFFFQKIKYVPKSVTHRFNFKLYKEKEGGKLFFVTYRHKSRYHTFYYIVKKDGNIMNVKKSIPEGKSLDNWDRTQLIRKEVFNWLIQEYNWQDTFVIKNNFCYLLSNFFEKDNSSSVVSIDDYDKIIDNHPFNGGDYEILTSLLSRSNIEDLLKHQDNTTYYYGIMT